MGSLVESLVKSLAGKFKKVVEFTLFYSLDGVFLKFEPACGQAKTFGLK